MFSQNEVNKYKVYGVLSYIGILFIIGLIVDNNARYIRFHANQGIILLIAGIIGAMIGSVPIVGELIGVIISIGVFVGAIIGIVTAIQGEEKPLPLIGGIRLIR